MNRHCLDDRPEPATDRPVVYLDVDWGWVRELPTSNPYVSRVFEPITAGV